MAKLKELVIVTDLDKTLCTLKKDDESYADVKPLTELIDILNKLDCKVYIESSRNMLTQNNDEAKVIKNIGKTTLEWLDNNNVRYDGIKFGKTLGSCYIDDKALRPKEFIKIYNSLENKNDMNELLEKINKYLEEN